MNNLGVNTKCRLAVQMMIPSKMYATPNSIATTYNFLHIKKCDLCWYGTISLVDILSRPMQTPRTIKYICVTSFVPDLCVTKMCQRRVTPKFNQERKRMGLYAIKNQTAMARVAPRSSIYIKHIQGVWYVYEITMLPFFTSQLIYIYTYNTWNKTQRVEP